MPLTEQERAWLERRKNLCLRCRRREDCRVGTRHGYNAEDCRFWEFCRNEDYKDAARFEARVARELTNPVGDYMPFCMPGNCYFHERHNCRECRLMHARIAVEAEMLS